MSGIYFFSIILLYCLFINGFKKFSNESKHVDKKFIIICAFIFHILFIALYKKITIYCGINLVCNFIISFIIYKFSCEFMSKNKSLLCSSFFLLNPVYIVYAATWTKPYSIYFLCVLLIFIFYYKNKIYLGHTLFLASLFINEYILYLYPITLIAQSNYIFKQKNIYEDNNNSSIKKNSLSSIVFYMGISIVTYLEYTYKLQKSLFTYPYTSCNAFNFWTCISKNWINIYEKFYFTSYFNIGIIILIVSVISIIYLYKKLHNKENSLIVLGYIYMTLIFCFFTSIHEDFFAPVLIILLMLFIITNKKQIYIMYVSFSILHFMNLAYTLSIYNPKQFNINNPFALIGSFLIICSVIYSIYYFITNAHIWTCVMKPKENVNPIDDTDKKYKFIEKFNPIYTKYDYICIAVLTVIFAFIGFYRLGNNFIPQTSYNLLKDKNEIVLDLGSEHNVDHLSIFNGYLGRTDINVLAFNSKDNTWEETNSKDRIESEFNWNNVKINNTTQFLRIVSLSDQIQLREIVILDDENNTIIPVNTNQYSALFDEQDMYLKDATYFYRTMFDEVYYTRTAYEFINGLKSYEITHPPLGKTIIALGIEKFGLNPFGWRFMSVIFGILMVPLMYIFSRKLFKNRFISCMCTLLLCFDFMHFTLSRICTIDIFVAFFIFLMYYFMYCYITVDFIKENLKNVFILLGLCGISTGLAISTKWTGFYAAFGLAIIFFASLYFRYIQFKNENTTSSESTFTKSKFSGKVIKIILFCFICFVIIPISLYVLSYIPVVTSNNTNNLFLKVYDNLKYMFDYHTNFVTGTHSYSSTWYQWPFIRRPLWDSITIFQGTNICSTVSTLGNPLIWWPGIFCVIYCFYLMIKEKDIKAGFLTIAYMAQLVPWMFVKRYTMIYHYLPCSLFLILSIGYTVENLCSQFAISKIRKMSVVYCLLVVLVFGAFYPAISGYPVNRNYVQKFLELRETWNFE